MVQPKAIQVGVGVVCMPWSLVSFLAWGVCTHTGVLRVRFLTQLVMPGVSVNCPSDTADSELALSYYLEVSMEKEEKVS